MGGRVLRFPGLVEHLSEFPELNCSLGYCVCEKDCPCNVADDRSFQAHWKRWKIDHFCHPRSNLLGIPSPPPPFPSLSNRACHASYPRSGPNPAVRSQSGREKFARAMKVLREEESVRARKGVSYMAVFQCNIDIYILSDENLKHVLRLTLSVFERHESLLLTPDIFKPICTIENVKFQWHHAIKCNSPFSRVLVTKEPRFKNTTTFPAHPGRPRGSQSVWDKRCNQRFQARAEEVPRTIFYLTSSTRSQPLWLLIGAGKLLCFSAESESSRPGSRIGSSART